MTDTNDDDRGRPPRGRASGERSDASRFQGPRGPRSPRERGEAPFRPAPGGDERPRRTPRTEPVAPSEPAEERIAKAIARAGIASRRDAEGLIAEGRVTLNGEVLASPAINVTAADAITVDGEPLPARERTRLWIFHKPRGLVTTARDPEGRPTVFESLPEDLPRVVAIGRLDINTEGLLLLTNDGGLAKVIAHPETGWLRRYRVRAHGDVTQADLDKLRGGVTIEGMDYGPIEATLDRVQGDNVWITLGLREGKNREVKRILEHLGLRVNRLIRLSFGPFQLGDLEPGLVEEVRTRVLKDQLGQKLAEEAGVDFESPVREPIAPFGSSKAAASGPEDRPRARPERPPARRDEERSFRPRERDERSPGRDERSPGRNERPAARATPARERHGTVWRAEEDGGGRGGKAPRRGADAKAARSAAGERPRERVGAIAAGERKVLVERLVSTARPDDDRPTRPARSGPPRRDAADERPRRDDRGERPARRPDEARARPFRAPPDRDGAPRRPRPAGPPRGRDDRPGRGEFAGTGFRAGRPERDGKPRGGFERGGERGDRAGPGGGPPRGSFGKGPGGPGRGAGGPRPGGPRAGGPGPRKGPPRGRKP